MQHTSTRAAAEELVRQKVGEIERRHSSKRALQAVSAKMMKSVPPSSTEPPTTQTASGHSTPLLGASAGCWGILGRLYARMFGQPVAKDGVKVTRAVSDLEAKVADLEQRAADSRGRARELAAEGRRQEALKALRRAKEIEKQLATVQTALAALERQASALESAALSREVSKTLSSTSKSVKKKAKKLLQQVDQSVDDANDVNDMSAELNDALAGLEAGPTIDEDELEDELESMVRDAGSRSGLDVVQAREVTERVARVDEEELRLPATPSHGAHQTRKAAPKGHGRFASLQEEEDDEAALEAR